MKTTFFQYRSNLRLIIIVMISSPFLELLNYAVNVSMIGRWNFEIFLRDILLTIVFFLIVMMILSHRILVKISVTNKSLIFLLFGKKLKHIQWSDISSMQLSKRFIGYKLIISEHDSNISSEIDLNYKELLVFHKLCSFQPICDEIKRFLDMWSATKEH